jgi:ACS family pantothenate transporter-like MFS transporter
MNGFQYAVAAWLPIVIFPQTMAPSFRYGFPGTFGLVVAALVAIVAIQILHVRSTKNRSQDHTFPDTDVDEESSIAGEHSGSPKYLTTESKIQPVDRSA